MLEEQLKRIRAQIRFGRVVEASQALEMLVSGASAGDLPLLLPLHIEVLMKRGRFDEAAAAIDHALAVGVPDAPYSLREKREQCRREASKKGVAAHCDGIRFRQFIDGIPRMFRTAGVAPVAATFVDVPRREDVARFAHHQGIDAPYHSWNGARTLAAKAVFSHIFAEKIDVSRFDREFVPRIEAACRDNLPESGMLFYDDIYGDLVEIARGILVGVIPRLHQQMRGAYDAHLFPCGWIGDYPAGQMLVHRLW
ncbi:hypothetical protein [Burkholderia ubonensis]|uniref:Uncharacterized protein n=1 Tax=Burkholderia ubonensis TaxID=101571 RepID=A0A107EWZ7_9BURK|nr:hypothetical protein [Burkholderia ubonensis]KWD82951.1 hypothetical protein WL71_18535 [Burkholderia ubonensis]KWD87864.1 hypothetical protein WL70_08190 [Burkholderia ubonensis]KWD93342.1 hypothetical protein WL73_27500 [Burkholderia ubonensis]KWD98392.1 hypothetical protein WL72_16515 [Burkholderia ubonensis]